jgi:hypothetical protein
MTATVAGEVSTRRTLPPRTAKLHDALLPNMADFTLLELHLEDASLSANSPFGSSSDDGGIGLSVSEESSSGSSEEDSSGRGWLGPVIGLLFLVGVAFVARKRMNRRGERGEEESASFVQKKLGRGSEARSTAD